MCEEKTIIMYFSDEDDKYFFLTEITNMFKEYLKLYSNHKENNKDYKYEDFLERHHKPIEYEIYMAYYDSKPKTLLFYDILKPSILENYMHKHELKYEKIIFK